MCNAVVPLRPPVLQMFLMQTCVPVFTFPSLICRWHACLFPSVSFVSVSFKVTHYVSKILLPNGKYTLLQIKKDIFKREIV